MELAEITTGAPAVAHRRSPNYPSISFNEALTIAKKIEKAMKVEDEDSADDEEIATFAGYRNYGSANTYISALVKYSLLDKEDGHFSLSSNYWRLAKADKATTLKLAQTIIASTIPLRGIVEQWGYDSKHDGAIADYLRENGFTHIAVTNILTIHKAHRRYLCVKEAKVAEAPNKSIGVRVRDITADPPAQLDLEPAVTASAPTPEISAAEPTHTAKSNFAIAINSGNGIVLSGNIVTVEQVDLAVSALVALRALLPQFVESN